MDKIVVVVFDGENQAYEGSKALKDLHDEGSITLYESAVIAKDGSGQVTVKQTTGGGAPGTALGLLTGGLIGLLAGPAGVAAGASAGALAAAGASGGALGGSLYDL